MTSPSNHLLAPSPLPCHVEFKWRTRMTRSVDSCEFYFDMFRQDDLTSTEYVMRQLYPWNITSTIHCFSLVARSVNNHSEASWFNDTTIHEANYLKSCFISGTNGGVFFENAIYDQGLMNALFQNSVELQRSFILGITHLIKRRLSILIKLSQDGADSN